LLDLGLLLEEQVDIGGIPVRLIDTAGLRETSDLVERIGVDRARSAILEADLILWLISPPDDWTGDLSQLDMSRLDKELDELRDLAEKTEALLLVAGKEDLAASAPLREWLANELPDLPLVPFSAQTREGLPAIRQAIVDRYNRAGNAQADEALVTSSRHKACLDKTLFSLEAAALELERGDLLDLVAALVRSALDKLGRNHRVTWSVRL